MDHDWIGSVRAALDEAAGPVDVFFRDDDAGWADERLLELLDRFAAVSLPVDLAVIPAALGPDLASELRSRPAGVHQHGYAHVDHERGRGGGESSPRRKCEFGAARPLADQRRDLEAGRRRMDELLGARVDPIFTPPWNRCTPGTAAVLVELGFAVLSREAKAEPAGLPGLAELPVSVDWFAHRRGVRLTQAELGDRIAAELRAPTAPVGLMFHHAVMGAAEMDRMSGLLELLAGHEAVHAHPMRELIRRQDSTCPAPRVRERSRE